MYHPWLYLFLVPAIAHAAVGRGARTGTIELLMTLPIPPWAAILGKFLAAWAFVGVALVLTFPMWITVNVLGRPDNGVILRELPRQPPDRRRVSGHRLVHLGADQEPGDRLHRCRRHLLCPAGMSGVEMVLNVFRPWAPPFLIAAISSLSFLTPYEDFTKGIFSLTALIFYASVIGFALFANKIILDQRKAA